uniref:Uncharacterized protein n=1 Tax=Triticum urartu TaxID=4572 RepID=A0A8R7V8P7_TRIUA
MLENSIAFSSTEIIHHRQGIGVNEMEKSLENRWFHRVDGYAAHLLLLHGFAELLPE